MADQPESKRSIHLPAALACAAGVPAYAELHCKTNFSFLEGASHPGELVERAGELDYAALAITDRNSLAGVVRAHRAARQIGFKKLLIGAEITPHDAPPIVLWASDRAAYGRLSRLITRGRRNAPKGECRLSFADVADHAAGLLAGIVAPQTESALGNGAEVARYGELFGDRCYLLAELHRGDDDARHLQDCLRLSRQTGVPLAASGGVCFHEPERQPLCDVLTAIRIGCTVAEAGEKLFPNAERYLRSPQEMAELFARAPGALARTLEIADRCSFSLDELRYDYPEELVPAGQTPLEYLSSLTWQGAAERYPAGIPEKVCNLLRHELQIIADARYEAYFLTVYDLVRFAKSEKILCQGRGSAANSAVCYCLGVTAVDPDKLEVLFERFISPEREEAPDIDVDFEHERREEVLQYLYRKYGRERAALTAEVITYHPRSAVRDVGKALGLSLDKLDALAKIIDHHSSDKLEERLNQGGLDTTSLVGRQLLKHVTELERFPRHLSQHVGGMVLTQGPLCELVPIENAAMPDRTVIQWNKDDLDELKILKVDCLALGMLTAIRKCFDLVRRHAGRDLTLSTLPQDDLEVYDMISRADTMGVFQIESRAQMSMLPRLQPKKYYDLVIEVAIVRPGPIQGNMVHPYLRRRMGEEEVTYPNDAIREVLKRTLGVPLFQEQAMRLAVVAAGFTPSQADQLRRAMAGWGRPGLIDQFHAKLVDGMQAKGLSAEFAKNVFNQIKGFGEYGFPESHAASFAILVYVSAWLKHYYPAHFCAALINSQPMGFYAPAQLIRNAQEHGVAVRPIDVNHSDWDCTVEAAGDGAAALRLGLRLTSGLSSVHAERIQHVREAEPFRSLADFIRRTGLNPATSARLARADAFGSLALDRRQALWQALPRETQPRPLWDDLPDDEPLVGLPPLSDEAEVLADYQTVGMSLKAHPISFFRQALDRRDATPAGELARHPNGQRVQVAGLVLVRQRPGTAKGITFVTLEDETGAANLIVRPEVWERYRKVARLAQVLLAHGRLQIQGDAGCPAQVIHVLVDKLEDLSGSLRQIRSTSRDFH